MEEKWEFYLDEQEKWRWRTWSSANLVVRESPIGFPTKRMCIFHSIKRGYDPERSIQKVYELRYFVSDILFRVSGFKFPRDIDNLKELISDLKAAVMAGLLPNSNRMAADIEDYGLFSLTWGPDKPWGYDIHAGKNVATQETSFYYVVGVIQRWCREINLS